MIQATKPIEANSCLGMSIRCAVDNAKLVALALNTVVKLNHNATIVTVKPDSDVNAVVHEWCCKARNHGLKGDK